MRILKRSLIGCILALMVLATPWTQVWHLIWHRERIVPDGFDFEVRSELRFGSERLDGPFSVCTAGGAVLEEGQYEQNREVGVWTYRDRFGRIIGQEFHGDDDEVRENSPWWNDARDQQLPDGVHTKWRGEMETLVEAQELWLDGRRACRKSSEPWWRDSFLTDVQHRELGLISPGVELKVGDRMRAYAHVLVDEGLYFIGVECVKSGTDRFRLDPGDFDRLKELGVADQLPEPFRCEWILHWSRRVPRVVPLEEVE